MSKINSASRNLSAEDETPLWQLAWGRRGKNDREKSFSLQFGHPRSVEVHGHAGRAGGVTHLSQHATPLLLIILIPKQQANHISDERKQKVKVKWKLQKRMVPLGEKTYCQTSVTSVGATSLLSVWTMAKPPTAYSEPPLLTRLTELLSWGNSVKGSHLTRYSIRRRSGVRWSCVHVSVICPDQQLR